jgi:phosphatidylserine decarboxylase
MSSSEIRIRDRLTGLEFTEKIYGEKSLLFLYGKENFFSKIVKFLAKISFPSILFAFLQRKKCSRKKIVPFIHKYGIDPQEFQKKVEEFTSFEDFFIRRLNPLSRPIQDDPKRAILPADARYLVFPRIQELDSFYIKGKAFDLVDFLQDKDLAKKYEKGSMVIARLAPVDYHRFHFPFDCRPSSCKNIKGWLYSVSPIALRKNLGILWENKRCLTSLHSPLFGEVLFVEIGATFVGRIHQSFVPNKEYKKGEEKGYFGFGGSSIVLLFESQRIWFDEDLLKASQQKIEVRGLMGQSMGRAVAAGK